MAAPSTFAFQDKLPKLPVPELKTTVAGHLRSLEPLVSKEELARVAKLSDDPALAEAQKLLVARAASKRNWLEEWWLKYAYLAYPDPITVWSNYFVLFDDDAPAGTRPTRIAAWHVEGILEFHAMVRDGSLPVETMGRKTKTPLCMSQFPRLLNTTRLPGDKMDSHRMEPQHRHVVILSNRQYYRLDADGLSLPEIEAQLDLIVSDSQSRAVPDDEAIGVLTGASRPRWAQARDQLRANAVNKATLDEIETCVFLLVFDSARPTTTTAASRALLTGDARNRFFDKVIQVVVFANGRAGMNGEHSPIDAISTVTMVTHTLRRPFPDPLGPPQPGLGLRTPPRRLPLVVPDSVRAAIREAHAEWVPHEANLEFDTLVFGGFGSKYIQACRMSPDAFIQMAVQLAYYKLYKKGGATYETAQTRMYWHGRTETVRTLSAESLRFTETMEAASASLSDKHAALAAAVTAHIKQMGACTVGKGFERHLMGLKLVALENNRPVPAIIKDPTYALTNTWKITSSNVTGMSGAVPFTVGGYGPPGAPDSYGCCYCTRFDSLRFAVAAHASCSDTSVQRFVRALEESLTQMGEVIAQGKKGGKL